MFSLILVLSLFVAAPATASGTKPGEGVSVQPIGTGRPDQAMIYEILKTGLEELGYKVKDLQTASYAVIHVTIGQGDADFTAVHWDGLHQAYYNKSGGDEKLKRLGPMYTGSLQGYFIDKATADKHGITKMEQFKDEKIRKLFDSDGDGRANLTACNPGWGCEKVINHHLKEYGMENHIQQDKGQYFALMANTVARYKEGKPIFFYAWTPAWMLSTLKPDADVVWVEVPFTTLPGERASKDTTLANGRNPGFVSNNNFVLANLKFAEKNPAAAEFLAQAKITVADLNAEAHKVFGGEKTEADTKKHAEAWIKAHQAQFDAWLAAALKAAK
ncbi:MAG: glycine betaine/L-proline ABC transporter substrate-binding protein ProX [Thermodesulfobacteriota bacterium]